MEEIHSTKKQMPIILRKGDGNNWLEGEAQEKFQFHYEVDLTAQAL